MAYYMIYPIDVNTEDKTHPANAIRDRKHAKDIEKTPVESRRTPGGTPKTPPGCFLLGVVGLWKACFDHPSGCRWRVPMPSCVPTTEAQAARGCAG